MNCFTETNASHVFFSVADRILRCGEEVGSRDGATKEIQAAHICLTNPLSNVTSVICRNFSLTYASAETLWYLSGSPRIAMVKAYAPQYERFADPDGTAYGAYGPRIMTQLSSVLNILNNEKSKETRQAIIALWKPEDIHEVGSHPDMPCTLNLQFLVRKDELTMHVNMRSNDVWLGLPNDLFAWTTIQKLFANALGLRLGCYYHSAASMHLYHRNLEKAKMLYADVDPISSPTPDAEYFKRMLSSPSVVGILNMKRLIQIALKIEGELRLGIRRPSQEDLMDLYTNSPALYALVYFCSLKWGEIPRNGVL